MKNAGRFLRFILFRDSMLLTRLGLALGSLLWALFLLMPAHLFPTEAQIAAGTGRQTYALMAQIAPENIWGVLFLVHSVWSLYTVFSGVRNTVTLAADGFLGCILWTAATVSCFAAYWPHNAPTFWDALAAYPPPAAMAGELVMAIYAWWHMVRFWAEEESHHTNNPKGD